MLVMFSSLMFLVGMMIFSFNRKHLLLLLLSLEFLVICVYYNMVGMLSFYNFEFFFLMVFLTMAVCESALGLSILVSVVRTHGSDYFSVFNLLW
uniref:NADH-ubiquinone oxidoreductase chain 4L n=1 Tax=Gibbium aequinoctiale TaxID=1050274 RepID=A0A8J9W9J2_9COLE|nr:NADH dehydrogenase subunit 4L [Gibbium aequinoctiale]ATN40786.1 NADH dehydrogenase subunit 4L [Gibbium aequinoctiale]